MRFNSMDIANDDQFGTDHVIDFVSVSGKVLQTFKLALVDIQEIKKMTRELITGACFISSSKAKFFASNMLVRSIDCI